MNSFGRRFRIHLFGESHGAGVGVVLDGVPAGLPVELSTIQAALDLRRPGTSSLVSARSEADRAEILSGVLDGRATGSPLCIWLRNQDADSRPYRDQAGLPRPGHADWPNQVWSRGFADLRGGGHSSGRLTAPIVAAGAVAQTLLHGHGISCAAHLHQVGSLSGAAHAYDAGSLAERVRASAVRTGHTDLETRFVALVDEARRDQDSLGGVIEFVADGLPVALGDPLFDGVESQLAHLLFAIPAVKGVDLGAGFAAAAMRGSEHNDPYEVQDGRIMPATNHAGGALGGRTTGAPLRGRVAVKPTASLPGRAQATVDPRTLQPAQLELTGRHDPCIAIRAVPVMQACVALVLADFVLLAYQEGHLAPPAWRRP